MITIPLTRGYVAVIDDEDARLAVFKWHAAVTRWPDGTVRLVYARRTVWLPGGKRKHLQLHREVLGVGPEVDVDHGDHDGLNCRRHNLRAASDHQNQGNQRRRADNTSGFKGVGWKRDRGCWSARIKRGGRTSHLGYFDSPEAAAKAYDAAARETFGPFAYTNFPITEAA